MFSFTNSEKEEVSVLIDVGNGTITGALVVFKKENKPRFIYIVRKFFATNEKLEAEKLELEMSSLFEEVLASILNNGLKSKYWKNKRIKIENIFISFASPWFLSKTKCINLSNEKEFVITKAFLNDILVKEATLMKKEMMVEGSYDEPEIIEKSIVHSKINGYVLDDAIGKTTKKFDASVYMSVVSKKFLKKILAIIHKHSHIREDRVYFNTFPLVSFTVIRDLFTKESNFLLIDVTGEITDITLVEENIIEKTVSIPSGKNFILRQISKKLNVSVEIAESTLKMYIAKKIDDEIMSKISEILFEVEREWSIYVENALQELSPNVVLPSTVFLTSDSEVANIYIDFLSIPKNDTTSVFRKNIKINLIDLEKMKTFYQNESGFVLDEFIVLLSLFYKKILNG